MKSFVLPLIIVVAIAVPTMLGFIPVFLGVPAMLVVVLVKDVIFLVLARGLPMAIISVRMMGGMLWGIMEKTGNIIVDRVRPRAGMVFTKEHGAYNAVAEGKVGLDGVPLFLSPEEVGYNVKIEHLELLAKLKKRGINNILEIIDKNEYGQFKNFKDDPRIRDLKEKLEQKFEPGLIDNILKPRAINLAGLNDFHRYAIESAHPFRQDANVKIGIAEGTTGGKPSKAIVWLGVIVVIAIIALGIIMLLTRGDVKVILENAKHVVSA